MEDGQREICPSPEDLEFSGPVQCPIEGCGKELPSSACLRMHVTRRHYGKRLERESESLTSESCVAFYCPVRCCNRSKEGGKPFPRLGQLKQVHPVCSRSVNCTSSSNFYTALPDGAWAEELFVCPVLEEVCSERCVQQTRRGV